jgi:long-chain acyl-CoA synthetase
MHAAFSAAATVPQEVSRRWTERFGRPVYEGYGLTECSPFASYNHDSRHKSGSVGTAIENTELRIVDPQDRSWRPASGGKSSSAGRG